MSGKNKLVPRLLGVTKESIVRVDERTKEVSDDWWMVKHPLIIDFHLVLRSVAFDPCETMDSFTEYFYTGKNDGIDVN